MVRSFPLSMCPSGGLVQGDDGYFYGVTIEGGMYNGGTLYRLGTDGSLEVLHHFEGTPYTPIENAGGTHPEGTLVKGDDGTLYGNTRDGGTEGNGTLFSYQPSTGLFSTLHHFTPTSGMGRGNLTKGPNGALYGTCYYGGAKDGGTIFRFSKDGTFTILYEFLESSRTPDYLHVQRLEPNRPTSIWVGEDESIYGTTSGGGPVETLGGISSFGYGTAFRLDPNGNLALLHEFTKEFSSPYRLVRAGDGNFYAVSGINELNNGTVLKLTPAGEVSAVKVFTSWEEGDTPSDLIVGTDGALYGTTGYGGPFASGVAFRVSLSGDYEPLYNFPWELYGFSRTGLIEATDGCLYGATSAPDLSQVPDALAEEPAAASAVQSISSADSFTRTAVAKRIGPSKRNGAFRIGVRPGAGTNRSPIVRSEVITVRRGGTTKIPVLRNDKDPDRDALQVKSVTNVPAGFSANFDPNINKLILSTSAAPSQTAVIGYTVTDGTDNSAGKVVIRPAFAGNYFWQGEGGARFQVTLTAKGALAGTLKVNGKVHKLRAAVGLDDTIVGAINASRKTSIMANLKVTGTPYQISGTVTIEGFIYEVEALRR